MGDHIPDGDFQFLVRVCFSYLVIFGIACAMEFPYRVCHALWVAGTIHTGTVGPRRSKSSLTLFLKNVLRNSPGLWYRLIRTRLWRGFLEMAVVSSFFIWLTGFSTIIHLNLSLRWLVLAGLVFVILGIFLLLLLSAILLVGEVADGVTVSGVKDGKYGSKAFKKGRSLLKGKLRLTIGVSIVWILISYSVQSRFGLGILLAHNLKSDPKGTVNTWDSFRITTIAIYCVLSFIVNQVYYISLGVLCASLEAIRR